jgi:hypothetical protein
MAGNVDGARGLDGHRATAAEATRRVSRLTLAPFRGACQALVQVLAVPPAVTRAIPEARMRATKARRSPPERVPRH